jgi:hypothetical protein
MIAHVGAVPLEELVPALAGAGSELLAARAWIKVHVRRRRDASTTRPCAATTSTRTAEP